MDTARQILRFSIPGSVFLLHAVVCYLIYRRIQGVPFADASEPIQDNITAVTAVLAAIPVGFLIYQFYYFTYEPVLRFLAFRWRGRYVRRDRGGQILRTLDPQHISRLEEIFGCKIELEEIHSPIPPSKRPIRRLMHAGGILEVAGTTKALPMQGERRKQAYQDIWYTHWYALRSAVDIAASHSGGEQVKAEYTTLSDIYHSLGAANTAVLIAGFTVFLVSFSDFERITQAPELAFAGWAAVASLSFTIYACLYTTRGRTWRTAAASLTYGLRWMHWRHGYALGKPEKR